MTNLIRRREAQQPQAPVAWEPFRMMRELLGWDPFREMESVLPSVREFTPRFEVKERKDAYVFHADLPGVKESDLEISLTGNRLTVSGKREAEEVQEGERYYAVERAYGSFTRFFTLPEGCDPENVQAELKDGVLSIVLPKKPEVQPKRIEIRAAGREKAKA